MSALQKALEKIKSYGVVTPEGILINISLEKLENILQIMEIEVLKEMENHVNY